MIIVALTTSIATKGGGNVWYPCEVEGCETIEQIFARLHADHILLVNKLETHIIDGHRVIKGRIPVIVGVMGVVTITPNHLVLSEDD